MFRISFLTDDKHVTTILHALSGKARELECVPVVNAVPLKNGKVHARTENPHRLLMDEVRKRKLTEMNAVQVRSILADLGLSTSSYSHMLYRCMQDGFIKKGKKVRNGFIYNVVPVK